MQNNTHYKPQSDSGFGILAAGLLGPAFGAGVSDIWECAEIASDIYTDRYQAATQRKLPPVALGQKNTMTPSFAQMAHGFIPAPPQPKPDPAAELYYHKLAQFQMNRRNAPRMAA